MGLVFFFFPFYTREFPLLFFLLETEQGSRQAQAAAWVLAPVTEPWGSQRDVERVGCGTGAHQGSGAERGKARHRRGQRPGSPGRGGEHPVVPMAKVARGRSWLARGGQGDRRRTPWGGLQVTRTPSDPSQDLGKSLQDPWHPQPFPCCQPLDPTCPHAGGAGTWLSPSSSRLQGDKQSPLAHPGPRLWLRSSCCRAGTGRGAEGPRGDRGQQFREGWRGCSKRGGSQLPPCMALEYFFEKTWHEM